MKNAFPHKITDYFFRIGEVNIFFSLPTASCMHVHRVCVMYVQYCAYCIYFIGYTSIMCTVLESYKVTIPRIQNEVLNA